MYNLNEISQQLDTLLTSLNTSPDYAGNEDRRFLEFLALSSKISTYAYCYHRKTINQIESVFSNTYHPVETHRALSKRLTDHMNRSNFNNTKIQNNIRRLYQDRYLHKNLDWAIFMTAQEAINEIKLIEELDTMLTALEKNDTAELALALRRYRKLILPYRSNFFDIIRSIGIMALLLGLHFTPLTLPFFICEIIAFSAITTELMVKGLFYVMDAPPYSDQPEQYRFLVEIADDIEQQYNLKPPSVCYRFFSCFQGATSVEHSATAPENHANYQ